MTTKKLISKLKNKKMQKYIYSVLECDKVSLVQKALNKMGKKVAVDGFLGMQTILAIKSVNNKKLMMICNGLIFEGEDVSVQHKTTMSNEPSYIKKAKSYLGLKEIKGKVHEPIIVQFHKDVKLPVRILTDEIPWCGSFVGSCMLNSGHDDIPKYSFRAKSWLEYGFSSIRKFDKISYGSICVKSRKGGGHVTFAVGQSSDGKYLYCLGGNQGDKVSIAKYRKDVFMDFRLPKESEYIPMPTIEGDYKTISKEN